jgi:hypothetical protein
MDDTADPAANDRSPPARPRRRGLTAPLPAVVVGLGLASTPAAAQIPVVARPDFYTVPADMQTLLPVTSNDTLNNTNPTYFDRVDKPVPGGNAFAQQLQILFTPPTGYTGPASFLYCIESLGPLTNSCTTVQLLVQGPATPVPALGGAALVGLSGVLGWLGMRLRRRA